jgi:hypothetical protein
MNGKVIFIDDTIINWVGTGLAIFLMLLTLFFCGMIAYFKSHPDSKKKMYSEREWKNVPSHVIIFLLVGFFSAYGFWWEITRIDSIEALPGRIIVLKGIFGNSMAEFSVSGITDLKSAGSSHKVGYGNTYVVTICAGSEEFMTRPLLPEEKYNLLAELKKLNPHQEAKDNIRRSAK